MKKEKGYIIYRKIKALLESVLYYLFRIIPIHKGRIVICTFEGKGGFCCNPRYIVEKLHERGRNCQFFWLVNDVSKNFPSYIKPVKNTIWRRAFYLSTAEVWIDNYRKPLGTKKRRHQHYMQTWHGTGVFKTLGLWRGDAFSPIAYLVSKRDSDMTDCCVVDSDWNLAAFPKGLLYNGIFLKYGQARCDILINGKEIQRKKIREKYHLSSEAKLVMYAPTFRESAKNGVRGVSVNNCSLDFLKLQNSLKEKFGGEWYICMRLHPQLAFEMTVFPIEKKEKIIDMSQADDMTELLAGVDVLITDYSSAAMDAGFAYIPVFLYVDDLDVYKKQRGGLFWEFPEHGATPIVINKRITPNINAELPFMVARDNEELENNIMSFQIEEYIRGIRRAYLDLGLVNDGCASERAAEKIEEWIQ